MRKKTNKKIVALVSMLTLIVSLCAPTPVIRAVTFSDMSATLSTLKIATDADQEIMFTTTTGLAADETIILTYDSDFVTTDVVFTDIDLSFEATPDGVCTIASGDTEMALVAGAPVTTSMGFVNTSSTVLTFTNGSTAIAGGSEICIQIGTNATGPGVNMILNPTTVNSFDLAITGTIGEPDDGIIVITTVTDDTVVTTATVVASLSLDIVGDETIGFGTLSSSASRWATNDETGDPSATIAHTIEAGTNSTGGYTITVKGDTLTSTGTPADSIDAMGTEQTLTTDQEEFGLRITAAGGSCTTAVDTDYDNTAADTYFYGATASATDVIVSCGSASDTTTYSLYYAANIAANTEAHTDYTASLIYVATGNF